MTWPGKKEAIVESNRTINKTLIPEIEKSLSFDSTKNIIIEGDNLQALKIIHEDYLRKVRMIYIDPPYNTGNDFVYNDDYSEDSDTYKTTSGDVDEEGNRFFLNSDSDGRIHTNWLNMMFSRLKIARDLLTDDGFIFISIDSNELANLLKICDEIFGNSNFVSILSVENNPKGRKNSKFISVSNEFLVIYSKDINCGYFLENIPKDASEMTQDEDGNFVHNSGKRVLVGENNFNKEVTNFASEKNYCVYYNPLTNHVLLQTEDAVDSSNAKLLNDGYKRYVSFRSNHLVENTYTRTKFMQLFNCSLLDFKDNKIYEKNESTTTRIKSILTNKKYQGIVEGKLENVVFDFKTTSAGTALKELFKTNDMIFDAPKNVNYIKLLISLIPGNDFTVLDFFAGSGTTAQAVMELNSEDGGKRNFILIQIPEKCSDNSIAKKSGFDTVSDITIKRVSLCATKMNQDKGLLQNESDNGIRVFKVESSNMKDVYYSVGLIQQGLLSDYVSNIKDDRKPLDLVFQVMLDLGISLSSSIEERNIKGKDVFFVGGNSIIACFDSGVGSDILEELAKFKPLYVCFRDSTFDGDSSSVNCEQIFKTLSPITKVKVI